MCIAYLQLSMTFNKEKNRSKIISLSFFNGAKLNCFSSYRMFLLFTSVSIKLFCIGLKTLQSSENDFQII